jgi:Alkylmercury lyase
VSTDVTPGVAAALDAAAIPQFKVGPGRHARLTDSERELYFWILRRFAESGRPPGAETREAAEGFGLDAHSALATLAKDDLVHTDREWEITVAYPFSGRTSNHVVRFEGGHEVYAMCAIDALGIAPMFDEAIEIASQDPLTGEGIEIELTPAGTGSCRPEGAVVVCGASGSGESFCSCCPVLNFFASRKNGERWLAGRPDVRGYVMTMDEAIEAGRAVFRDVLARKRNAELPSAP